MEEFRTLGLYAVVGAIGGIIREISVGGKFITFPHMYRSEDGRTCFDMGVLGAILCGMFVAVVVDHSLRTAAIAAVGGTHLIELWVSHADQWIQQNKRGVKTEKRTAQTSRKNEEKKSPRRTSPWAFSIRRVYMQPPFLAKAKQKSA